MIFTTYILSFLFVATVYSALPPPRNPDPDAVTIDIGLLSNNNNQKEETDQKQSQLNPNFSSIGSFNVGQLPVQGGKQGVFPGQIPQQPGFPNQGGILPNQGGIGPGGVLPGQVPIRPNQLPTDLSPDVVAFTAVRASDFTRNAVTQIRFDTTVTDIGYGWIPDRSEFVCYYAGLYYFAFSALSPVGRQFKVALVKNNQDVVAAWGDSSGYQTGSNTAILFLQQNDRVALILQEGSIHESTAFGRGYTSFSGFRIR